VPGGAATAQNRPRIAPADVSQNRPEAPPGKITQFELFDHVPHRSFAGWEDPLWSVREPLESIQNLPEAPLGLSESLRGKKPEINSLCMEHDHFIVAGLERGLHAQRIWQDLVSEQGFQGRYWSVKRYLMRMKARQPLPFRRRETASGVEAQVDFGQVDFGQGDFGQRAWVMGPDGKRRRLWDLPQNRAPGSWSGSTPHCRLGSRVNRISPSEKIAASAGRSELRRRTGTG
jgi:hypothetical protein